VLAGPGDGARLLQVATDTVLDSAAAGHAVAQRLAVSVRERLEGTYGLAVSPWGSAPPEAGQTAVPTAWVALAAADGVWSLEARQTGNPAIFAPRTAKTALDLLRRRLLGLPLGEGVRSAADDVRRP
jgi:nicotinamide mononucleotide (NMN) deamidase PncC